VLWDSIPINMKSEVVLIRPSSRRLKSYIIKKTLTNLFL